MLLAAVDFSSTGLVKQCLFHSGQKAGNQIVLLIKLNLI